MAESKCTRHEVQFRGVPNADTYTFAVYRAWSRRVIRMANSAAVNSLHLVARVARAVRRQSVCKLALFNHKRRKARRRAREYWEHDILLQRSQDDQVVIR